MNSLVEISTAGLNRFSSRMVPLRECGCCTMSGVCGSGNVINCQILIGSCADVGGSITDPAGGIVVPGDRFMVPERGVNFIRMNAESMNTGVRAGNVSESRLATGFVKRLEADNGRVGTNAVATRSFVGRLRSRNVRLKTDRRSVSNAVGDMGTIVGDLLKATFTSDIKRIVLTDTVRRCGPDLSFKGRCGSTTGGVLGGCTSRIGLERRGKGCCNGLRSLLQCVGRRDPDGGATSFVCGDLGRCLGARRNGGRFMVLSTSMISSTRFVAGIHGATNRHETRTVGTNALGQVGVRGVARMVPPSDISTDETRLSGVGRNSGLAMGGSGGLTAGASILLIRRGNVAIN